jgi:hypothetical protein
MPESIDWPRMQTPRRRRRFLLLILAVLAVIFFGGRTNVFTSHINAGFFHGAALPDPARLLQGTGKFMRHVKLRPGTATNAAALSRLIDTAYSDIKARVENG